jgi:hypothetical protein
MNRRSTVLLLLLIGAIAAFARPAAASPIRWLAVNLGVHTFGHLSAPQAVVARASADDVGFECGKPSACAAQAPPSGGGCGCIDVLPQGPTAVDVARDGSVWLLDGVKHRLLAWQRGRPVRSVALPTDVGDSDFVVGRDGTIYVFGGNVHGRPYLTMYALTRAGRVRWQAPTTVGSSQARLMLAWDGTVYSVGPSATPTWTPLTTPNGRPLSLAVQRRRSSHLQPLARDLRLSTTQVSEREIHFALVDGAKRVVRAWRVTSRTSLEVGRVVPTLAGADLVVGVGVYRGTKSETLILRLGSSGATRLRLTLAGRAVWDPDGTTARSTLRIAADGRIYQLRTDPAKGVTVARYSL